MRHRVRAVALATAAAALALAPPAAAGVLTITSGTLTVEIWDFSPVPVSISSNGPAAVLVSSGAGTFVTPPGLFGPATVAPSPRRPAARWPGRAGSEAAQS